MDYVTHLFIFACIYAMLAVSLEWLIGETGMLSVMHGSLFGVGAYASAFLSAHQWMPIILCIFLGALASGLVGTVLSASTARLTEDRFSMATFGGQILLSSVFSGWVSVTGGPQGLRGIPHAPLLGSRLPAALSYVIVVVSITIAILSLSAHLKASRFGLTLRVIREDEAFALSMGVNISLAKTLVFAAASCTAGLAGGVYAHYITFIDPSSFTVGESILITSMVIVGGTGSLWGPLLGAALLLLVPELLRYLGLTVGNAAIVRQILYGALLVLFASMRPFGLLRSRRR